VSQEKKKNFKLFYLFATFFIVLFFFFFPHIITFSAGWYLRSELQSSLNQKVQIEKIRWQDNKILFENIHTINKDVLSIESLQLKYKWQGLKKLFSFSFHLKKPKIVLFHVDKKKPAKPYKNIGKLLPFLSIEDGQIQLADTQKDLTFHFSFEPASLNEKQKVFVWLNEEKNKTLDIDFSFKDSVINSNIHFSHIQADFLQNLMYYLEKDIPLQLIKGDLIGDLSLQIQNDQINLEKFALNAHDFAIFVPSMQLFLEGASFKAQNEMFSELNLDNFLSFLNLDGSFEDLTIRKKDGTLVLSHVDGKNILKETQRGFELDAIATLEKSEENIHIIATLEDQKKWNLSCDFADSNISFHFASLQNMNIEVSHFFPKHFFFFQKVFGVLIPQLEGVTWEKGSLDASLTASWENKGFHHLSFEKLKCKNIGFYQKENDLHFAFDLIEGSGKIDLSSPETFFCDLAIRHGQIVNQEKEITDLATEFRVEKGIISPSYATFRCNDMVGNLEVKGPLTNVWGKMQLKGELSHLLKLFVPKEKIKASENDNFIMSLEVKRKKDEMFLLSGQIDVKENEEEKLQFDFLLNELNWQNLKQCILKGKINGEKIDLKRWSNIFGLSTFSLDGKVNLDGEIENSKGLFQITPEKNLSYLSEHFNLEINDLQDQKILLTCFLNDEKCQLYIPTFIGNFSLPHFQTFFSVKNADILLENNILFSHVPICTSDNVNFSGKVRLDLEEKDTTDLDINVTSFSATSQDLAKLLHHFAPLPKFCFDTQGDIEGSFQLLLDLQEKKQPEYKAEIKGENLAYELLDHVKIQNLNGKCLWDSKKDHLETENLSADIKIGDEEKGFEQYSLSIPLLRKNKNEGWDFDIRIEKQIWNVLRLVGGAVNNEGWQIIFDQGLCHFFGSKFYISDFSFDKENNFKHFLCELELENDQLLSHLEFLIRSQTLPIKGFSNLVLPSMTGKIQTKLEINHEKNLSILALAKDLQIGDKKFSQAKFSANKVNDMINIQEFFLDDIRGNLLLKQDQKNWEIVEGKLRKQKQMSFLFKGKLFPEKNSALFQFYDFKVDVGKLADEFANNFAFPIKGKIEGEGKVNLLLPSKETSFSYSSDWLLQLSHFSISDLEIENKELVHLHFSKKKGIELNNVDLHCYHQIFHPFLVNFRSNKISIDEENKKIHCERSKIFVPLKVVFSALNSKQLKKSGAFYEFVEFIKQPFSLENDVYLHGNVDFDWGSSSLKAHLPKANLSLNGKDREFKDIIFSLEDSHCLFDFTLPVNNTSFKVCNWISLSSSPSGRITVWEEEKYKSKKIIPLTFQWLWQDHDGILVQDIQGSLLGMEVSFHQDEKKVFDEKIHLLGSIKMDLKEMEKIFPPDWKKARTLFKLGKGYELRGSIALPKKELNWFEFQGAIAGKQFEIGDFRFKTLLAQIEIQPKSVKIHDFKISDRSGIITIDELNFITKDYMNWSFSLPTLIAQDIRPSLIERIDQKEEDIKPFLVRQLKLENLAGDLSDPLSIKGVGEMDFINSFKRGVTVLDIPAELLGRLVGLDQELLIPVKGKLEFHLQKGKIFFSNLIDTYSENNRSQFFLMNDEFEPFMDFQGNMKIHIKMKQFVLFKLTENFILSIGGNIQNPDIKLHRKKGIFSFND